MIILEGVKFHGNVVAALTTDELILVYHLASKEIYNGTDEKENILCEGIKKRIYDFIKAQYEEDAKKIQGANSGERN